MNNGMNKVNATEAQASFLNEYADAHRRYRNSLEHLKYDIEKELVHSVSGLSHQDLNEVQKFYGAVAALDKVIWFIFSDLPENGKERRERAEEVKSYLTLARTKNESGMMDQNWFIAERGN